MEITKINDTTWCLKDVFVYCYLLTGKEKALLIDTGATGGDARSIAEQILKEEVPGGEALPLSLLITHADPDHIAGNAAFAEVMMHPGEEALYRSKNGPGTVILVKEGDTLDLGGRVLTVIHVPGHTPGSLALLDEKNRFLFSGDSVQNDCIFMFGPHRNFSVYPDSLRHLMTYADHFDTIWAGHGTVPVKNELISQLIEGAESVLSGTVSGTPMEMHGCPIYRYDFPYAGFFGARKDI